MPAAPQKQIGKITAGQNAGDSVAFEGFRIMGVLVPTYSTSSKLRLQVSQDGSTWYDLKDTNGNTLEYAVSTGGFAMDADYLARFTGYNYVRANRSTTGAADVDVVFILSQG